MGSAASTIVQRAPSTIDAEKMKELVGDERFDQQTFEIACDDEGLVTRAELTTIVMKIAAEEAAEKKAAGSVVDDGGREFFMEEVETGAVVLVRARWLVQYYEKGVAEMEEAAANKDATDVPAKITMPSRQELPNLSKVHEEVDAARQVVQEEIERIAPEIREAKGAEAKFALRCELREKERLLNIAENKLRLAHYTFGDVDDMEKENCRIAVVSAPWVTKEHADPDGFHLSKVVPILKWYLKIHEDHELLVFWDWMSLYQHGYRYNRASITAVVDGPLLPNGRPSELFDLEFDTRDADTPGIVVKGGDPRFFSQRMGEEEIVGSKIKIGTRSARVSSRIQRFPKQEMHYQEALKKIETWFQSPITLKILQDIHPPDAPVGMKRYKERAWCQFEKWAALCFTPVPFVVSCQQLATTIQFFEPTKRFYYNAKNRQLPTIDEFMKLEASEKIDGFMAYLEKCEGVKPETWTEFMTMRPGDPDDKHRPEALRFGPLRRVAPPTPDEFGDRLMDLAVLDPTDRKRLDKKWTAIYHMAYAQKEELICNDLGWAFPMDSLRLYDCQFTLEEVDFSDNPAMTGTLDLFEYLKVLKSLTLAGCVGITGTLKPLRKILGLEYLNLSACYSLEGNLEALNPLVDLIDLDLSVDPDVDFENSHTEFTMGFTGTLAPLKACTRLRYLNLRGCTKLQGLLEPLKECKTLRSGETHRAYINLEYCMELDGNLELENGLFVVPGVVYGDPDVLDKEPERKLTPEEIDRLERGLPLLVPLELKVEPNDIARAPKLGNCKPVWGEEGRPVSPTKEALREKAVAAAEDELPADEHEAAKVLLLRAQAQEAAERQKELDAFVPASDEESHGYSTDHELGSLGDPEEDFEPSQHGAYLPPCVQGNKEPYYTQAPDPREFLEFRAKMIEEEFQKLKDEAVAKARTEADEFEQSKTTKKRGS